MKADIETLVQRWLDTTLDEAEASTPTNVMDTWREKRNTDLSVHRDSLMKSLLQFRFERMTEDKLKKSIESTPDPSVLYRYPLYRSGKQWRTLSGFTTATQFLSTLDQMNHDFKGIGQNLAD